MNFLIKYCKELTQEIDIFLNDELTELNELLNQEVVSEVNAEFKPEERSTQAKSFSVVPNQVTSDRGKKDLPPRPFVYRTTKFEQLIVEETYLTFAVDCEM